MNNITIPFLKNHIVERLKMLPLKINAVVLYGSLSKGEQTLDSDIDLLIVADEIHPRKHKRGKEIVIIKECLSSGFPFALDILLLTSEECISNFKNHNPLFLDITCEGVILIDKDDFLKKLINETKAYIIEKKLENLTDGWRFPVLYREPTFLSKVSNMDFAIAMLTDGERDLKIGINIMEDGYFDKAIYHFQQSVEKSVKAVLLCFGEFKKTHFVGSILLDKLKQIELSVEWKEEILYLIRISEEIEPEVTWSRYPGIDNGALWIPYKEYTLDDAQDVEGKSEKAVKIAHKFLGWWFKNIIPT